MRTWWALCVLVAAAGAWLAACGDSSEGSSATPDAGALDATVDGAAANDGATGDSTVGTDGASGDSAAVVDAAPDADAGLTDAGLTDAPFIDDASYNDFTDGSLWTTFNAASVNVLSAGFWGGTFDGRYVYFSPEHNNTTWDGLVTRYDTQSAFDAGAAWTTFDALQLDAGAGPFYGAAFDGRYVYFIPPATGPGKIITRYDSQADFAAPASWQVFDTTTVSSRSKGFLSATFDGRYLYLVPYQAGGAFGYDITRFDTKGSFSDLASWAAFDTQTVAPTAGGFYGGLFDGRYVYLVPDANGVSGKAVRYDTQAPFATATSWQTFDTTTVNPLAKGFHGGAFDGRYIYFVPNHAVVSGSGVVARFDTTGSFTQASAWSTFDLTTKNASAKGFESGAFDGRYVYFVSSLTTTMARYDTLAPFGSAASWGTVDTNSLPGGAGQATSFVGSVFDGHFLYLVPQTATGGYSGRVFRFDAKSPPHMPGLPAFSGSFL